MAITKNIKVIRQNKLFSGVAADIIKTVFKSDEFLELTEGEIIYQTGDEAYCIFLLLKGETKIKYPSHHYISNKLANDFFGEKEIFDKTRRISSAVANTDCLLYQLTSDKLKDLLADTDLVEKNIKTFGEVILPEMEQTAQSKINLSSSDKPISFKANAADQKTDVVDTAEQNSPPSSRDNISDQQGSDNGNQKLNKDETVIQDEDSIVRIEEDILDSVIKENINLVVDDRSSSHSEVSPIDFSEVLDALLIATDELTVYDTINSILFALKKLLASAAGEIYLVNENAGEIGKYVSDEGKIRMKHYKISDGLTGTCALQKKTLNFDNPTEDSRFVVEIDRPGEDQLKRILYVPLITPDKVLVGVLLLARNEQSYTQNEIKKVELISTHAAAAIRRGMRAEQILMEGNQNSEHGVYNYLEDNIAIPIDIINRYTSILKKEKSSVNNKGIAILLQLQIKFLHSIIRSAFEYNKPDFKLNLEQANLSTYLQGASELLSEYCEARGIKLYRKTGNSAMAKFDAGNLFVALYQLIKNACDVSEPKGNVYISLETDEALANIIVSNEGNGFYNTEDISFTPVFDESKGRYRMGLTITKKIIDLHSGGIKFSGDKNESTKFTISLPLIDEEQVPSLLDHFEPAFVLNESENDFTQYLEDNITDSVESSEL